MQTSVSRVDDSEPCQLLHSGRGFKYFGFQVLLDSLHPLCTMMFWWYPPVILGEAVKIFLASVSSGIHEKITFVTQIYMLLDI